MIKKYLKPTLLLFLVLTAITGVIYPLFITAAAQVFFPHEAQGSLIAQAGKPIGSVLIGQEFRDPKYFWGRISATVPAYNAAASSGSNFGPTNHALIDQLNGRIKALKEVDPDNVNPIPVDLVTSSASGLDPHITIAAALYQVPRVMRLRKMSEGEIMELIRRNTQGRFLGMIGEPVVNVLKLNLGLDERCKHGVGNG